MKTNLINKDARKKALVVDDDDDSRLLINDLLEESVLILQAKSSSEALLILSENPDIELVILDIMLPDVDGITLLRQIREIEPDMAAIAVSALNPDPIRSMCKLEGFNAFVSKPIEVRRLKSLIQFFLYVFNQD